MKSFHFVFDAPPTQPTSTSSVDEIVAWAIWCAMDRALKDIVLDESEDGLKIGCLDYSVKGKYKGPDYVPLALFPHLRGAPLKELPSKATGSVDIEGMTWNMRVWICEKLSGDVSRLCAILQLLPPSDI